MTGNGGGNLNEEFSHRYPRIPEAHAKFLGRVSSCVNAADTVWFLCADDYNGKSGSAFAWNEFEQMELESAEDDGDQAKQEIREFWDGHLPFLMSVSGDYAYLALRMSENHGSVVAGYGPDFEGVTEVAASFDEFVRLYSAALNETDPELNDFL